MALCPNCRNELITPDHCKRCGWGRTRRRAEPDPVINACMEGIAQHIGEIVNKACVKAGLEYPDMPHLGFAFMIYIQHEGRQSALCVSNDRPDNVEQVLRDAADSVREGRPWSETKKN